MAILPNCSPQPGRRHAKNTSHLDDVARLLTRAGWTTRDGYPVTASQVADTLASLHDHLAWLEGSGRPKPWGQSTPAQQAMARAALFHG